MHSERQCYVCKGWFHEAEMSYPEEFDGEYGLCRKDAPEYYAHVESEARGSVYDGFDDDSPFDVLGRL